MNYDAAEIDRIVREVLARLGVAETPAPQPPGRPKSNGQAAPGAASAATDPGRCVVTERVVSLATLEGKLQGASVVAVRRGAVITPAVRDELRSRKIRLEYYDAAPSNAAASANLPALIVGVGVGDVAWEVSAALDAIGAHVQGLATVSSLQHAELPVLVERLGDSLAERPALGLVLTSRPAAAVCLANRQRGVRAVWGCTLKALKEALETAAPNVLIYNPKDHPAREQRLLVREFVGAGLRECPALLQDGSA